MPKYNTVLETEKDPFQPQIRSIRLKIATFRPYFGLQNLAQCILL